jgi:YHS domain-containing protein
MGEQGAALDPVCGMDVFPATAAATVTHDGHTFYFCSKECADRFRADPGRYESRPGAAT